MGQVNSSEDLLKLDLASTTLPAVYLDGYCDKQFDSVKEYLKKMLETGAEENVQLCVYVGGKCVIDLYGTAVGDCTYNADTLQVSNT